MNTTKTLPYAPGTPLRCTRETEYGTDVVHGTVREWHNDAGWLVESPLGGIVASPERGVFLTLSGPRVSPEDWRFEVLT